MGDEVNIGGEYENTWGAVRCPFYKGSGYRDETLPANKNWSRVFSGAAPITPFSSGYPEAVTPIMRAFPLLRVAATDAVGYSTSMSLGVRVMFREEEGEEDLIRAFFFLCAGESQANVNLGVTPNVFYEEVYKGYGDFGPGPNSGAVGYDINSTRATMTNAVVVVTFYPTPNPADVTTQTVTLDNTKIQQLLPDDVNADQAELIPGVPLGDYLWPEIYDPDTWVQPFWTIDSVTLA